MKKLLLSCFIALNLTAASLTADVRLPSVIADNMVLQRDMSVSVWGWADPSEKVIIDFNGQNLSTVTSANGEWKVTLSPMNAGGPYKMTVKGDNKLTLSNILVGEVWICSGQSNMEMRVKHVNNAVAEVGSAYHPNIRLFHLENDIASEPLTDCIATWEVCRPSKIGKFSATAYFFGRALNDSLGVPIGLIHASWGGTPAEVWVSMYGLKSVPELKDIVDRWKPLIEGKPQEVVEYFRTMGGWEEDIHEAIYAGFSIPKPYVEPPKTTPQVRNYPSIPSWNYNAMIAPLEQFAIRGAIWYQGESNAGRAYQYRTLFPTLIQDWRRNRGQGDFPFLFVQISSYRKHDTEPVDSAMAELREAQLMTLNLPNTGMAVSIDIGDANDVHPKNKQDVGKRLALAALKTAYGKDIVYSGPIYDSMTSEDGKIHCLFKHIGSGLKVREGESLAGFAIAGEDKKFVWAKAVINGDDVVVWNDDIRTPIAVRYGWSNNPDSNLYNAEGLPASPFRTDDWPGITEGN